MIQLYCLAVKNPFGVSCIVKSPCIVKLPCLKYLALWHTQEVATASISSKVCFHTTPWVFELESSERSHSTLNFIQIIDKDLLSCADTYTYSTIITGSFKKLLKIRFAFRFITFAGDPFIFQVKNRSNEGRSARININKKKNRGFGLVKKN